MLGMLAILAIALQGVLSVGMSPVAADPADPFSVICHSVAPGETADTAQPGAPAKHSLACDHCSLCSTTPPPGAPDVYVLGRIGPERIIVVLSPASVPRRAGVVSDPKQARGPPQTA